MIYTGISIYNTTPFHKSLGLAQNGLKSMPKKDIKIHIIPNSYPYTPYKHASSPTYIYTQLIFTQQHATMQRFK